MISTIVAEAIGTIPVELSPDQYEAVADQLLAEMRQLGEQMQIDRREIQILKSETARLAEENRLLISRLKASF